MLKCSWIKSASSANKAGLESAAAGCWQKKAKMPNTCASTAQPVDSGANHEAQLQAGAISTADCSNNRQLNIIERDIQLAEGEPQDRHSLRQA